MHNNNVIFAQFGVPKGIFFIIIIIRVGSDIDFYDLEHHYSTFQHFKYFEFLQLYKSLL